ncbi:GNAT family N-acetyltransferase [Aquimarina sp. U1-2]|uniref:GNAT family N-acetyltransferase n=1 Tax=Aquimarina sp. U1-2 TaxID=2823141 RepID=UPI001AECD072|nr:GNAT family N-acetyltransferase [Aquimarina sp. U1-2]MBP2832159.1 GNAT family N-acetyltransferase [Aquimarina sp. U1-2]
MTYLLIDQETQRLKFRQLRSSDFDEWLPLFKEKNTAKFLEMDPNLTPFELCEKWFEKSFYRYKNELGGMNVLINKETDQFIGQSGLLVQNIDNQNRLEVGYSILPKYWNQGYAFEAASKCRDFAFEHNFIDSLISVIHTANKGSEKVALKNGMTFEKKFDNNFNIFSIEKINWKQ